MLHPNSGNQIKFNQQIIDDKSLVEVGYIVHRYLKEGGLVSFHLE